MSSIDERVVEMQFNNAQFQAGVKDTNRSLDDLKKGLDLSASARGLDELQQAGNRFSLAGIGDGVTEIGSRFTALGAIAFGALASIGAKAVSVGSQLAKSLTIDPIKSGLEEYNTNLNSVQTILANTQSSGATLKDVNGALQELNLYSDQTIYNFSEMARNIGTFTAAGVALKPATQSIKGIANLAALSGSNSQQASTAMYQLSQAISAGRVGLQDWNSVVNAGMGGTVFQRALAQTAVKMGTINESAVKLSGKMKNVKIDGQSFRDSISAKDGKPSWLTSDVLTKTLQQFTGDMTDAQLAAEGFSKEQIKAIQLQAKTAKDAATQVKTLPQLIGTLQESAQSGWSQSFQYIFGDFEQAKTLFTGVNNVIGGMISASANARNKVLAEWEENGGRATAITALSQAFQTLMNVVRPIRKAFNEIFPPTTGKQLVSLTTMISVFAQTLQNVTKSVGPQIFRTFKGIFALLDIGRMIIVGVITTIAGLFGEVGQGAGSFLDITANIGDFLVALRDSIKNGEGLTKFFQGLGAVLKVPIALLGAIGGAIADVLGGVDGGAALDGMAAKVKPLTIASDFLLKVWQRFSSVMGRIFAFAAPVFVALGNMLGELGTRISDALTNVDYDKVLSTVNTALFAGLLLLIKKFMANGLSFKFSGDLGGGLFSQIKDALGGVTGVLEGMQQNLKANVLLKIAGALAILTASIVALSLIDPAALTKATIAMTTMFTQLGVSMALFSKISVGPSLATMPVLTGSMIALAIAVLLLATAVKKLSDIPLENMITGLGGLIVILGALAGTTALMKKSAANLIPTGLGLIAVAVAVRILVDAVAQLGALDITTLGKGLLAVAVILATLAGFTKILGNPAKLVAAGAGMVLIGTALRIMSGAIATLGNLDPAKLGLGLGAVAVALATIAGAVKLMPGPQILLTGAGLILVGTALNLIATAMGTFGGLSMDEIGKSIGVLAATLGILGVSLILMEGTLPGAAALIVAAAALVILAPALAQMGAMDIDAIGKALGLLAASLAIIAVSLILMTTALPGAAALIVAAGALAILAPVLTTLGSMSWDEIGRGLAVLAGALTIIGVAGALLTPVIPTLVGLGIAIGLLGAGLALAGVGVLAFAAGLTLLGVAGAAGAAGLTASLVAIANTIPVFITKIGEGIVAMAGVIEDGAPAIVSALVAILVALIDAIGELAPKIVNALVDLVILLAQALARGIPQLYQAGYKLLLGVLRAIASNIGKVVTAGVSIIVNFLKGIGDNIPRVIKAGVDLVIKFINGLADGIRQNKDRMNKAGANLSDAIVEGMVSGLQAGVDNVVRAAQGLAKNALDAAKALLGIHSPSKEFQKLGVYSAEGYALGLTDSKDKVKDAFDNMRTLLQDLLNQSKTDIEDYQDKILDLNQTVKDNATAVDKQVEATKQARRDTASGKYVKDEQKQLAELTKTRNRDTREIKDAQKAIREAEAKQKSAKKDSQRKAAEKQEKSARDRLADLTDKRSKDNDAIKEQQKVLAQARKDQKNGTYIEEQENKLAKLRRTRDKDNKSLAEAQEALKTAQDENPKAAAALEVLNQQQAEQQSKLEQLNQTYDDYSDRITDAKKDLDDARKTLDDYNKSITDQYSALKSIDKDTKLSAYNADLQQQLEDTLDFTAQLQELRARGLNDQLYDKFLKTGPDAIPFLQQLLESGKDGLGDLQELTARLDAAAASLGSTASTELYQAGVNAKLGLLNGLQSEQNAIKDQMTKIADALVTAINERLGIHSPSRVFAQVGRYSMEGLANGMTDASGLVSQAAEGAADSAVSSLQRSIAGISRAVASDLDMNPTIRPVLDLSAIQDDASLIGGILGRPVMSVSDMYRSAGSANDGYMSNQEQMLAFKDTQASANGTTYNQYNYSPKTLSASEIYRNTKNQLSVAKEDKN